MFPSISNPGAEKGAEQAGARVKQGKGEIQVDWKEYTLFSLPSEGCRERRSKVSTAGLLTAPALLRCKMTGRPSSVCKRYTGALRTGCLPGDLTHLSRILSTL